MGEKFFSFFMFLFLSLLSFFLTNFSINGIKSLDPIMIKIKEEKDGYEVEAVNAFYDDIKISPGIDGIKVDIDKSYQLMKKYGSYNASLYVYLDVSPSISIMDIYDRYVVSGNKDKKEVALIFKVEDTNYLEEIVYILRDKDVVGTFFVSDEVFENSFDVIKLIYLNNQKIESLGSSNNYSISRLNSLNTFLKRYINNYLHYCYSDTFNKNILNVCSSLKMHTIIPSINTSFYPYYDIKNNIENGSIIKFNINSNTREEIGYIINYLRQKDYKIVSLEKLLEE